MKKIIVILFMCLILLGCTKTDKIIKLMEENEYIILDVRTNEEYEKEHLKDSINIPYDEINENIELDKNKLILVYCQSGNRSSIAANTLTQLGYNVYDMGGINSINLPKESK